MSTQYVNNVHIITADVTCDSYSSCKANPNFTNGVKYPIYQPNIFSMTYAYSYYYAYWYSGRNYTPYNPYPSEPYSTNSYYYDWVTITIPKTSNQSSTQFCYILNSKLIIGDNDLPLTTSVFNNGEY
ncbi:MAG: hypothetical protein IJH39_05185 [Clostridia bacterium]|nr:hypothetical protein [Clostridia bacterium]